MNGKCHFTVATPEAQNTWLKAAEGSRKELICEMKKVKRAAKMDPGQGVLLPSQPPVVAQRELPVRFQVNLTPEPEARRSALVQRLHKLRGVPVDRAELMLESVAALLETREMEIAAKAAALIKQHKTAQ